MKNLILISAAFFICACNQTPSEPAYEETNAKSGQELSSSSAVQNDYEKISAVLNNALISGSEEDFEKALPLAKASDGVEDAWIDGNVFYIKYKTGGVITWPMTMPKTQTAKASSVPSPAPSKSVKGESLTKS